MSNFKYKGFLVKGKKVEERFAIDLAKAEGGNTIPSTKEEDINKHIDVKWIPPKGRPCTFDVKGLKKNNRSDTDVSAENTWVEFMNVRGELGWLYGEEDYISFETPEEWLVVKRDEFADKCSASAKNNGRVATVNPNQDFILYQRNGRGDVIMRIPYTFVKENAVKIIAKTLNND